jgi:hypothetical protein
MPLSNAGKDIQGEPIERTPLDRKFMGICAGLISAAQLSIYLIAGELGSLTFPQIQRAIYNPGKPKIQRFAYATNYTPQEIRNYALSIGFELYIGKRGLTEHYLVVDEKHVVESLCKVPGRATIPGEREGVLYRDNPQKAKEVIAHFEELKSQADQIKEIDVKADPFYQLIRSR